MALTATGAESDGCLPREGPAFTTEQLESLRPLLIDVVRSSGLAPVAAN